MVDIPGVITVYFDIWPIHYLHLQIPHYMLISLLSHPLFGYWRFSQAWSCPYTLMILLFICWNWLLVLNPTLQSIVTANQQNIILFSISLEQTTPALSLLTSQWVLLASLAHLLIAFYKCFKIYILTLLSRTTLSCKHQILPSGVLATFIAGAISNGHVLTYWTFNDFIFTSSSLFYFCIFPIVVIILSFKCY